MGIPINFYPILKAIANKEDSPEKHKVEEALKQFNLFAFILNDKTEHTYFDAHLNKEFCRLNLVTGSKLLFFALYNPPDEWLLQSYGYPEYRAFHSLMESISESRSTLQIPDSSSTAIALASSLKIEVQHMPCIVITQNFMSPRRLVLRTNEKILEDQLIELGRFASQMKHNEYDALARLVEKLNYGEEVNLSYLSGSLAKKLSDPLTKTLVIEAEKSFPNVKIISKNPEIDEMKIKIASLANFNTDRLSILIQGETGTGKSLFAEAISKASNRKGKYVKVDCGAFSEKLFESELFGHIKGSFTGAINNKQSFFEIASNGTIFLDEIGNIPLSLQPKILRVLDKGEYQPVGSTESKSSNALVVLATNKDLGKAVKDGTFMEDLYYRCNHVVFFKGPIPPLRNRQEDIPFLFKWFLEKHLSLRILDAELKNYIYPITDDCIEALQNHNWKGNIRELEGVAETIIIDRAKCLPDKDKFKKPISVTDLPPITTNTDQTIHNYRAPSPPLKKYGHLPKDDSELIELEKKGLKRQQVADLYGVSRERVSRRYSEIRNKL